MLMISKRHCKYEVKCRISKKNVFKHGDLHLQSQHTGARDKRIKLSKPDWTT